MRAEKRSPLPLSQLTFIGLQCVQHLTHNVVRVIKDLPYRLLVNRYEYEMASAW